MTKPIHYADLHTHTHFSFDCSASLEAHCQKAKEMGLSALAVTNHLELDSLQSGFYPSYLPHLDRMEIEACREKTSLSILYGVELGQLQLCPHLLPALLRAHDFDFVLASLHSMRGAPDCSKIRFDSFSHGQCLVFLGRYFDEITEIIGLSGIDALAHIDYPIRYMRRFGHEINMLRFEADLRAIFHIMINQGIALEVNTSGIRQGHGETLPGDLLLSLYRDCGGRRVTVGSDAHYTEHIGHSVIETADKLRGLGMEIAFSG